jgi:hypothetical protein
MTPPPSQKSSNGSPEAAPGVAQQDFANPTLSIINRLPRRASASSTIAPSREGTPPPLPPRPQLGFLSPRPATSHSVRRTPSRPQLVSKATTHLSLSNGQAFGTESREDSPASSASKQRSVAGLRIASNGTSDADDNASVRSYMPRDGMGDTESILGEVMAPQQKSETERTLLRSLGHRFVDTEAQSMFPPDPHFDAAFDREFDDVDDMKADGSNEGQPYSARIRVACADEVDSRRHAPMAREAQALPHPVERR